MEQEEPKDYVVQTFEEALVEAYDSLSLVEKGLYHLQNHMFLTSIGCLVIGYLAGTYFGVFW
jgi:hypothetical protein